MAAVEGANQVRRLATLSPCGTYRYDLQRIWDDAVPSCVFCMLNPSTADALVDDPTIRRVMGFASSWGYGGLVVVNLFALRATDPAELKRHRDPIGPENDQHIVRWATRTNLVVAAWGQHGKLLGRAGVVREVLKRRGVALNCLEKSKDGQPKHPLYLRGDLRPFLL